MSRRRQNEAIEADFAEVIAFLRRRTIAPDDVSGDVLECAKRIHQKTYSIILWKFRLSGVPHHAQCFVDEIASDALQILPHLLSGYNKTASLLLRGIIENTLRYIYFYDHPVEFRRLNRDKQWYVSVETLFEYVRNHFDFVVCEEKFDAISQMRGLYKQLSNVVHGRTVDDLEMKAALLQLNPNHESMLRHTNDVIQCVTLINFVMAIFNRRQLRLFSISDKRLILRNMPPVARRVWTEHE